MRLRHYDTIKKLLRNIFCVVFLLFLVQGETHAQFPLKLYTIKGGKMHITLSKNLSEPSIDSFISQYNLADLALKQFIKKGFVDSIAKSGWEILVNTREVVIITKQLTSFNAINNPADKLRYTEFERDISERFPAVSKSVRFGYNRFKNKYAFSQSPDSVVVFYLKGYNNARKVMLAGSFNFWAPDALPMTLTDSGWIGRVKLKPGKYWYKFIIDGQWRGDPDNQLSENDGYGNTNSVFYFTNTLFELQGYNSARKVFLSGSFNDWRERELSLDKTSTGWKLVLYLAEGTHTYRYIVDRKWMADPANPDVLPNEHNDVNSVVRIGKSFRFTLPGYEHAKKVFLSGSFNGWRKEELLMNKTSTGWMIDHTLGAGNHEYRFIVDGKEILDPVKLGQSADGNSFFILEPNYTFRLKGFPNARKVFLAGTFNNWNPGTLLMRREGDEWVFSVHLEPGKHLYKFIVDGKWIIDPANKNWEENEHRTNNSVLWLGQ